MLYKLVIHRKLSIIGLENGHERVKVSANGTITFEVLAKSMS